MRRFDPHSGPRRHIYPHFRGFRYPWTTLCCPVLTNPDGLKERGGLFGSLLWAALSATNAVPELRRRIRVEDDTEYILEHNRVDATCTVARADGSFAFTPFAWNEDRNAFLDALPKQIEAGQTQEGLLPKRPLGDDLVYLSCLPWTEVTSVQHAMSGDPLDCVPRIVWGRVPDDGRLTVCLTVHHALVDGRHISAFFAAMQAAVAP